MNEIYFGSRGKYKHYSVGSQTIAMPVEVEGLPKAIEVEGLTLQLKSSFHVSLVCMGKVREKLSINDDLFEEHVLTDFKNFIESSSISLLQYHNDFKFVSEGVKRSVVVMCEVSNVGEFFDFLRNKYDSDIETQPTHVTLYTLQPEIGIFLVDSGDMRDLTKPIEAPINLQILNGTI